MNVDRVRFQGRLWSIRDSQIVYYLQNLKQSIRSREVFLRHFMAGDG